MEWHEGSFYVVGGLPEGTEENYVYQYDPKFKFLKRHVLPSGYTRLGIQTTTFADGQWWFGCYGSPAELMTADEDLTYRSRTPFDASIGIASIGPRRFLIGRNKRGDDKLWSGRVVVATADAQGKLTIEK